MGLLLAHRAIAAALSLVIASGAVTLDRACCLFEEEHVVTCCESARVPPCDRVQAPPCCDEDAPSDAVTVERAAHAPLDALQLVAIVAELPRLGEPAESRIGPADPWLPGAIPRLRTTSRLLL